MWLSLQALSSLRASQHQLEEQSKQQLSTAHQEHSSLAQDLARAQEDQRNAVSTRAALWIPVVAVLAWDWVILF